MTRRLRPGCPARHRCVTPAGGATEQLSGTVRDRPESYRPRSGRGDSECRQHGAEGGTRPNGAASTGSAGAVNWAHRVTVDRVARVAATATRAARLHTVRRRRSASQSLKHAQHAAAAISHPSGGSRHRLHRSPRRRPVGGGQEHRRRLSGTYSSAAIARRKYPAAANPRTMRVNAGRGPSGG